MAGDEREVLLALWDEAALGSFVTWALAQPQQAALVADLVVVGEVLIEQRQGRLWQAVAAARRLADVATCWSGSSSGELVGFFDELADAWTLQGRLV